MKPDVNPAAVFAQMYWCAHHYFGRRETEGRQIRDFKDQSWVTEAARLALGWSHADMQRMFEGGDHVATYIYTGQPAEWTIEQGRRFLVDSEAIAATDMTGLHARFEDSLHKLSHPGSRHAIFWNVLQAMQSAEEMGGPEGPEYIALMNDIAAEADRRASIVTQRHDEELADEISREPARLPGLEELALEFARVIRAALTEEEMEQLLVLNAEERNPSICHSHDFCDANQAMLSAFKKCAGFEGSPLVDGIGDLMEAAHTLARRTGFPVKPEPIELRDTGEGRFAFTFRGTEIFNPCSSECGRFVVSPRYYGFQIWDTGGGCTAWGRNFVGVDGTPLQMLVTAPIDESHEIEPSGACMVGVYDDRTGEPLSVGTFSCPGDEMLVHTRRVPTGARQSPAP